MRMPKGSVGLRLSEEGKRLLERLARHHGVSQAAVIEMLVRREARSERIIPENDGGSDSKEPPPFFGGVHRICSIGYQERSPEQLIRELRNAGVTMLIDVRETPWSHRAVYSRKNLDAALAVAGIGYHHARFAGNPRDLRRDAATHADCLAAYGSYIRGNPAVLERFSELLEEMKAHTLCLFCYERHPDDCHRSILLSEWMHYAGRIAPVQHLAPDGAKRFAA